MAKGDPISVYWNHPDKALSEILADIESARRVVVDTGYAPNMIIMSERVGAVLLIHGMDLGWGPIGWVRRKIMLWAVLKYLKATG
jgi:hypothetical protein